MNACLGNELPKIEWLKQESVISRIVCAFSILNVYDVKNRLLKRKKSFTIHNTFEAIQERAWRSAEKTLSKISLIIKNDLYEVRIKLDPHIPTLTLIQPEIPIGNCSQWRSMWLICIFSQFWWCTFFSLSQNISIPFETWIIIKP